MYTPTANGAKAASCAAHAVVLQLPLEGVLSGGGLAAVLKRPAGRHPEWLVGPHSRDFFISFAEVCLGKLWDLEVLSQLTTDPLDAWYLGCYRKLSSGPRVLTACLFQANMCMHFCLCSAKAAKNQSNGDR